MLTACRNWTLRFVCSVWPWTRSSTISQEWSFSRQFQLRSAIYWGSTSGWGTITRVQCLFAPVSCFCLSVPLKWGSREILLLVMYHWQVDTKRVNNSLFLTALEDQNLMWCHYTARVLTLGPEKLLSTLLHNLRWPCYASLKTVQIYWLNLCVAPCPLTMARPKTCV